MMIRGTLNLMNMKLMNKILTIIMRFISDKFDYYNIKEKIKN